VGGCMNIDERIDNYTKLIEQETNPVFKMLYELNRNLLIKLKSVKCPHNEKMSPVRHDNDKGVE
jgi:hypothetical protein